MTPLLRDARHALRSALRRPGVPLVVILTLAVGIGANSAIFTYLIEVYRAKVPVPDPERVFWIRTGTEAEPGGMSSYLDAEAYREATAALGISAVRAGWGAVVELPQGGTTYRVGLAVSAEYFPLLGARFPLGRGFLPQEDRPDGPAVAVVGHFFWRRHLGADPAILGRTIRINGRPFTIVGVTAPGFRDVALVLPLFVPAARIDDVTVRPLLADRDARRFFCLLRLDDGVSREAAAARLAAAGESLDREHPWPGGAARHVTLRGIGETTESPAAGELMLAAAVALLLLLAVANVANLLLARAAARRREIAVRAVVGAGRGRIAARLLAESLLLAAAGGALGLVLGRGFLAYMKRLLEILPVGIPTWAEGTRWLRLDHRVAIFTLGLSLLTGCLFGLAPILHAWRTDLAGALKGIAPVLPSGRRFGARRALVVLQVTLSTVLLLAAGLLVRSLESLQHRDPGYDTDHQLLVSLATVTPRRETPSARRAARLELFELARRRLAELPEVTAATLASRAPGSGYVPRTSLALPERPDESFEVDRLVIGRDFFATLGIALHSGRPFDDGDRAGRVGAAIVNRAFVDRYWPRAEPLGRELRLPGLGAEVAGDRFVVVAVAADVRHVSRREAPGPLVYLPLAQHLPGPRLLAVARTAGPPRPVAARVREALAAAHPDLALVEVGTYDRQIAVDLYDERLYGGVAGLLAVLGLGLACLGIYSVMSFAVASRRRELAIRMAVGATAGELVRRVLGEALVLVGSGVVLGMGLALVLARLLASLLYGVAPYDPTTFLSLPPLLVAVGLAAAWLPAWRAGRVDPRTPLQEE